MEETQTEKEVSDVESEKNKSVSQVENSSPARSHESFWGAVLFAGMLLFVVASIGGVGWAAYTKWQSEKVAKSQPSITVLPEQSNEQKSVTPKEEAQAAGSTEAKEEPASDTIAAAKKLGISVLNGGAAKGSAGVLADFLKKEGYLKTVAGNTINNYTGVVVYYASGLEKEAEIIKESVVKKYPQAKILPADTNNKETSVSQATIILGK